MQKTFQFINAINGVSHSCKKANIFLMCHCITAFGLEKPRPTRRHYKAIYYHVIETQHT